jgi:hypothetical protein
MSTLYRNNILKALKKHYEAQIEFHKVNVDILLDNVVAVAEHPDVMATIDNEIGKISEWEEKLQILNKYF